MSMQKTYAKNLGRLCKKLCQKPWVGMQKTYVKN